MRRDWNLSEPLETCTEEGVLRQALWQEQFSLGHRTEQGTGSGALVLLNRRPYNQHEPFILGKSSLMSSPRKTTYLWLSFAMLLITTLITRFVIRSRWKTPSVLLVLLSDVVLRFTFRKIGNLCFVILCVYTEFLSRYLTNIRLVRQRFKKQKPRDRWCRLPFVSDCFVHFSFALVVLLDVFLNLLQVLWDCHTLPLRNGRKRNALKIHPFTLAHRRHLSADG